MSKTNNESIAAFQGALSHVISERNDFRIAVRFAIDAFTAYLQNDSSEKLKRYYRPDAERAVVELQIALRKNQP
jgi:hypothetical protein